MSKLQHGVSMQRSFVRYMVTGEDIINAQMAYDGSLKKKKMIRKKLL